MFGRALLLEDLDDFLDILRAGFRTDQGGIGRVHHNHLLQPDGRHDSPVRVDDGILAVEIHHVAADDVAGLVARGDFFQAAPTADIRPAERDRNHRGA